MKTKKKVAIITQDFSIRGGVKTVALSFIHFFKEHFNCDVVVISLASSKFDRNSKYFLKPSTWCKNIVSTENDESCTYYHVGAIFSEYEFMRYMPRRKLKELVKECNFIQVVSGNPAWSLCGLFTGIPVYLQVATLAHIERRKQYLIWSGVSGLIRKIFTKITRLLDYCGIRTADMIIVENYWMKSYCEALNKSVHFISPGIDMTKFKPSLNPSKKYILSVGRFDDPRKNIDDLIDVYGQIYQDLGELTPNLILAGHAGDPAKVLRKIENSKYSSKISYVQGSTESELINLYQNALCFVLCSDEEGFGMVIIEAMACGVPVVSTRSGGPDHIIDSGHDGYLVDLYSRSDLQKCITNVVTDEDIYMRFRLNGLKKIKEQYSTEVIYDQLMRIYR